MAIANQSAAAAGPHAVFLETLPVLMPAGLHAMARGCGCRHLSSNVRVWEEFWTSPGHHAVWRACSSMLHTMARSEGCVERMLTNTRLPASCLGSHADAADGPEALGACGAHPGGCGALEALLAGTGHAAAALQAVAFGAGLAQPVAAARLAALVEGVVYALQHGRSGGFVRGVDGRRAAGLGGRRALCSHASQLR